MTVPSTADARPLASMNATVTTGVGLVVVLLLVGSAVAVVVRFLPLPYESVLALIGVLVGATLGRGALPVVSGDLILFVLLPGLLFEAGFRLRWALLRQNLVAVVALATVGVGLTTAVVGALGHWALGLTVPFAILLGAMVSATDPVATTALVQRLNIPERLRNLFEAESLANDGTGVVVFAIALAATAGATLAPASIGLDFIRLAGGGVALGLVVGFAISLVTSRIDDVRVELSLTAVAAYGGYLLGTLAGVSGILVVVAAAIVLGNYGRPRGMSARTQEAADIFWDYTAFVLNTIVFVLIGFAVPVRQLLADPLAVLVGIAVALVARAAAVYLLLPPLRQRIPLRWQHLLVWGGLRGAVATALALSLAGRGDGYEQVRALTYGVVLTSILLQGVTFEPVARLLLRDGNPTSS
jgi:monovalent cation:H+ antiporter, CPA1 family